jgi:O-antigen/teichoic acid export membrane protein
MTRGGAVRLRTLMGWGLLGQGTYLMTQLSTLVALTRLAEVAEVGTVALATSVVVPVFFFFNLNMQVNFASGQGAGFAFRDFRRLLSLSVAAGYALILAIALALFEGQALHLLLILGLAKAAESFSELSYGVFQRHERMDLVALSLATRGLASTAAIWLMLGTGFAVETAFFVQMLLWCGLALLFDMATARRLADAGGDSAPASLDRMRRLARSSLMLGVTGLVSALHGNMPRYVIAATASVLTLGYFTVVAYAMQATVTFFWVMMHSLVARLTSYMEAGDSHALRATLGKLLAAVAGFAAVAVGLSLWIGDPLIAALFGPDYAGLGTLLAVCMLAASLQGVEAAAEAVLVAARRFGRLLALRVMAAALLLACTAAGMAAGGLIGVAWGIVAAYATHAAVLLATALRLAGGAARKSP